MIKFIDPGAMFVSWPGIVTASLLLPGVCISSSFSFLKMQPQKFYRKM